MLHAARRPRIHIPRPSSLSPADLLRSYESVPPHTVPTSIDFLPLSASLRCSTYSFGTVPQSGAVAVLTAFGSSVMINRRRLATRRGCESVVGCGVRRPRNMFKVASHDVSILLHTALHREKQLVHSKRVCHPRCR